MFSRHENLPSSKTTNFNFPDEWTETSWGFDLALRQVSFTRNIFETITIIGMDLKTMYSRRTITFQILSNPSIFDHLQLHFWSD
ncbi:unnamed protein product [Lathyrus sativus]|nr:unnamed protein product [Lathyrus sativus]